MSRRLSSFLLFLEDVANGRHVRNYRKQLMKTQWLSRDELRRAQLKKLRTLLKQAYDTVPHYHEAFKEVNFDPKDFRDFEDLRKVPILKRNMLVEDAGSLVSKTFSRRKSARWVTSGTTSMPVKFFRSKSDVSWGVASELRGYSWAGYEVGDKLALVWSIPRDEIDDKLFKLENYLIKCQILNVSTLSEDSMRNFAERMRRFGPTFVRGYTTATNVFASFLANDNRCSIKPKAVFTSAAMLFPHYRRNIEKAFDCKVYDYYASAEMSHIAAQCGEHEGLHISEENVAVEIVKDGEHAVPGEQGHVILTNLWSHSMPFIRYDIGDLGKIYPEECSCGRGLRLMKPVGRKYEYFMNADGSFTSFMDLQTLFEDLPIQDFQIVQESFDDIVVKIVRNPGYTQEHSDFILKHIKFRGGAKVRIEFADSLPLEKSGKLRHAISKLPCKYDLD